MRSDAIASLRFVIIDAADTEKEAAFWGTVLGVEVAERFGEGYVILEAGEAGAPKLTFQPVPESKVIKNRLHFDLKVPDIEAATTELETLGASRVPDADYDMDGYRWRVMHDPEGNEFCIAVMDD
ncbi:MAG: VOC family protein [Actinomycetota bacterium]|nr:VOC family protein [Actinomycetota bacterium]